MAFKLTNSLLLTLWTVLALVASGLLPTSPVQSQRNLFHWKRDLEYRLETYTGQRELINSIISSSIFPGRQPNNVAATRVTSGGNVRFSDLIIPTGSLVLDSHSDARRTVNQMLNKTQSYVGSKMNELAGIRAQMDMIKRQLDNPANQYIYKGRPPASHHPFGNYSASAPITGVRLFKQFLYGHVVESNQVEVQHINFTNVNQVLREVYMENHQFEAHDSKARLFFEGKKTFWRTAFTSQLKSGCCDRLRPLHTNRMMTRSTNQAIVAPVLLQTNDYRQRAPVVIRQLNTNQLLNRVLAVGLVGGGLSLVPSFQENFIQLHNLINIRVPNQVEILKTIVFADLLNIDEAQLSLSPYDNRLVIGFAHSSPSTPLRFDLAHDNYLLRYSASRLAPNGTAFGAVRRVTGPVVVNAQTHLLAGLEAGAVNQVSGSFQQFALNTLARVDRPAVIRGSVRFNALPAMYNQIGAGGARSPLSHNVLSMRVSGPLQVQQVNGMRWPQDLVILAPHPGARRPQDLIRVRGPVQFANLVEFRDLVNVGQLVNNIQMPAGVIPLHLNDFMGSVGGSNLLFVDGITAQHVTVHGGQFDDLLLRDLVQGDAQSLIMRSVFAPQRDGTHLIRAPLRVMNVKLFGGGAGSPGGGGGGMLNGFRPQEVIELAASQLKPPIETIHGKRTFLAPVEATDCIFSDINNLANWTNHLIRIDRPNTVQTIHTKLAFQQPPQQRPPAVGATANYAPVSGGSSVIQVGHFMAEFHPSNDPVHYLGNLNFSPEFFILHQALARGAAAAANSSNTAGGRYRVLDKVRIFDPMRNGPGRVNGIALNDIVTLDTPFRFADRYVMVGKVEVAGTLRAGRITSNYPIDAMDLVQFDKYRIPILGSRAPIRLNNLVLADNNRASFVQCHMLNGISFSEFANSIMSLTRPQTIDTQLTFAAPVNLEGLVRTGSSLNGVKQFKRFADSLKTAKYSFENGLQCNSVMIKV